MSVSLTPHVVAAVGETFKGEAAEGALHPQRGIGAVDLSRAVGQRPKVSRPWAISFLVGSAPHKLLTSLTELHLRVQDAGYGTKAGGRTYRQMDGCPQPCWQ